MEQALEQKLISNLIDLFDATSNKRSPSQIKLEISVLFRKVKYRED
jgi:hypothetical protein